MLAFFSSLLSAVGSVFDFFKQKRLVDAVEGRLEAEQELADEIERHIRTKKLNTLEDQVRNVETPEVKKTTRRIQG